ncbi:MAG: polyphosphate:AMP phosphotransferase [Verrucomicrobiae bacterium]|nr:polyphosphate:AMP phosphotransferase [Verrucomicrobiae bacterium]
MFKSIELGLKVSKEEYEQRLPKLRAELLAAQQALKNSPVPVIVVVSGVEGAGKAAVVNALTEWLDPRGVETNVFWAPSDEELARPEYWRFWRTLPARGKIGIFFGSWYTDPIVQRATGKIKSAAYDRALQRIAAFERMLADDQALIVKLWFHLSKKDQRKRLKKLEKDPATRWRVTPQDWKFHKLYDDFARASEQAIRVTNTAEAPWHLIDSADAHHQKLEAGRLLLEALQQKLAALRQAPPRPKGPPPVPKKFDTPTVLDRVDLSKTISDREYKTRLKTYQAQLNLLTWEAHRKKVSTVAVFEGWDAAGKGGAIRRVTGAADAKLTRVISIAAPTDEERAHHYLWRFWRHIPPAGRVTIFDRSWYGRVLVERVEGFATPEEWSRAYLEINDFEAQLVERGIVLLKFWLHISPEEQLRRFKERQQIEYKRHKITDEDWRNREKWNAYLVAVHDMITRTSTELAPWTIIPGNDKHYARVQVLKTFCKALEKAL